jgi:uncharacterized membrane protein (UPF0127 family)
MSGDKTLSEILFCSRVSLRGIISAKAKECPEQGGLVTAKQLINKRTGAVIVSDLEIANSPISRMVGLLGRKGIDNGKGLMITACHSIHTFFMKFPIDVIYMDKDLKVLKITENLKEFRLDSGPSGTCQTLELKAFYIKAIEIKTGDSAEIVYK